MLNQELIINELKQNPQQSRADLSKKVHLSKPAVSDIVKELIEKGIIVETGVGPSSGGKRPILLKYNARSNYVIGILIENHTIYLGLGDMYGEIVKLVQRDFIPPADGEAVIRLIEEGISILLNSEKVNIQLVLGATIGVSGFKLDKEGIISFSPTINWHNIDLAYELSNKLNIKVVIENDVNLMTIGEFYKGEGKGINDLSYLFIGDGIGCGFLLNGELYKGFHSASGEIGYMIIGDEKKHEPNLGVFEANYGRYGVNRKLKELGINIEDKGSFLKILQDQKNNKEVENILDNIIGQWAKATIDIISIIDPQVVILSGELINMDILSFDKYKKTIKKYVPQMPEIRITKLGSKAGLYGAFHLVLDNFHKPDFEHNKIK